MMLGIYRVLGALVGVGSLALVVNACGEDCTVSNSCVGATPTTDDGGSDGAMLAESGADVAQPPAGCDPAADPKDAPKCVVSDFGVFVDATTGADGNAGTKESPVKSITAALGKLGSKTRVYICEGTYAEHVKLTNTVSLYGGFACDAWSYSGTKAKVAPTDKGLAIELRGASAAVVLSDLEFTAKDASEPAESSIAAFIVNSAKVTLRRTAITAGKGGDGSDASAAAGFAPATAPDGTAGGAAVNPGGQTPNPVCATSIGGAGGKDGAVNGAAGQVAVAVFPAGNTGAGGTGGGSCATGLGIDGSYGIAGAPGPGAATVGTLDATGWKASDGVPGGAGGNGQGGGGGAQRLATGVGGSGGPGGCGGAGGTKGTAGGSSIALLVFESAVALEQSTLVAKDAGRGGNGAKGQKGQLGSLNGGVANAGALACNGGVGGIGGSGGGGGGGGGAGGLSVGVLYKGASPTVEGASTAAADTLSSVTLGQKGAGGTKGLGGDAAQISAPASRAGGDGTDGAPGEAKAILSIP
jgi:hypothetical protein